MEVLTALLLIFDFVCGIENILHLNQGKIKGSYLKSREGRVFEAFQGIPYAKPPVGDLRFKDPEPANPWDGILNATTEPPVCIQKTLFLYKTYQDIVGIEDCLYLNVYTPKSKIQKQKTLLPVMVWIPGGGYSSGHGGLSFYGPHYLLDKDVVMVSFNYRVGSFGFLSTEDDILPSNYGMKDQVLALKWVKNNIEMFGGDPTKVTIFGESAGGASVGLHLLSPLSRGNYYEMTIPQSNNGAPLCLWAVIPPGWARRRALALSTIYGCPSESKQLVDCFRKMPAELLVDLHYKLFEWNIFPSGALAPVVENCKNSNESFLCKYPLLDFTLESNVPILMGMNSGEGGVIAARICNEFGHTDMELQKYFDIHISSLLNYKYTAEINNIPKIGRMLRDRYFPDGDLNDTLSIVEMISGGLMLHGILGMAIKLSSPVNYYVYDYLNKISFNQLFGPCSKKLGVSHSDELISLFSMNGLPELVEEDLKVSKLMIDIWTSFANADSLTIYGQSSGTTWPLFNSEDMEYLLINSSNPIISKKPFFDEFKFWNGLPLLSKFTNT